MIQQVSRSEIHEKGWLSLQTAGVWLALTDFLCVDTKDDFGSDDEDNDFGEEEDEDGGSDYEEKRGKKGKKAKVEKPSKRGPKRKRAAGNASLFECYF